jgi:hypothetical protein
MLEQATAGDGFRRVNRVLAEVDVLNHALLVHDEGRPLSQLVAGSPDLLKANRHPELLEHPQIRITQELKVNIELLREGGIRRRAVTAYAENYGVTRIQLWPISLIGFEFGASSLGEGEHIENEDHVLLASEVAELDLLPIIAEQSEIRRLVSGTQDPRSRGLSESRRSEGEGHQG